MRLILSTRTVWHAVAACFLSPCALSDHGHPFKSFGFHWWYVQNRDSWSHWKGCILYVHMHVYVGALMPWCDVKIRGQLLESVLSSHLGLQALNWGHYTHLASSFTCQVILMPLKTKMFKIIRKIARCGNKMTMWQLKESWKRTREGDVHGWAEEVKVQQKKADVLQLISSRPRSRRSPACTAHTPPVPFQLPGTSSSVQSLSIKCEKRHHTSPHCIAELHLLDHGDDGKGSWFSVLLAHKKTCVCVADPHSKKTTRS